MPGRPRGDSASGALVQATLAQVTITNEIVFRDTFDVSSQSNDINLENSLRQSGNAAPLTYAANNGSNPGLIQLNNPDSPGRLRLNANGSLNLVSVSPNHNFTEGGEFTIEFDVDPGINDADSSSPDWAAVVFGATRQNVSVNGSDGMGILLESQPSTCMGCSSTSTVCADSSRWFSLLRRRC